MTYTLAHWCICIVNMAAVVQHYTDFVPITRVVEHESLSWKLATSLVFLSVNILLETAMSPLRNYHQIFLFLPCGHCICSCVKSLCQIVFILYCMIFCTCTHLKHHWSKNGIHVIVEIIKHTFLQWSISVFVFMPFTILWFYCEYFSNTEVSITYVLGHIVYGLWGTFRNLQGSFHKIKASFGKNIILSKSSIFS